MLLTYEIKNNESTAETLNGITYIQEIKFNKFGKEPKDFIKNEYNITNDDVLVNFFKPELHEETLKNISIYEQLTCF